MWFEDAYAVSDGIKCYPTLTTINAYNNWGPIKDTEAVLQLSNTRTVLFLLKWYHPVMSLLH